MTSSVSVCMALGLPYATAGAVGETLGLAQAGVGTSSVGATVLSGTVNSVTTTGGATAFRLGSHQPGRSVEVYNTSSTTALIFPPTGGTINGGSVDASVNLAQNKGTLFRYLTPLTLVTITGA